MRIIEKTGKSVEEAIEVALEELGVNREEAEVEVLEEPNKGLLGIIGTKQAKIRVKVEEIIDAEGKITNFLHEVLTEMAICSHLEIEEKETGQFYVNISGEDLGLVIGKRGQTLEAIQYLTNIVVNKNNQSRIRVMLDAEGYRQRREDALKQLANRLAHRVEKNKEAIMLEPMSALERKIIHTTLQDNLQVTTRSEGEEPNRKVVIETNEE